MVVGDHWYPVALGVPCDPLSWCTSHQASCRIRLPVHNDHPPWTLTNLRNTSPNRSEHNQSITQTSLEHAQGTPRLTPIPRLHRWDIPTSTQHTLTLPQALKQHQPHSNCTPAHSTKSWGTARARWRGSSEFRQGRLSCCSRSNSNGNVM